MIVTSSDKQAWSLCPSGEAAIRQRLVFLLSTYMQTCPLNREFGIKHPIDSIFSSEISRLKNNIITQAKKYIPNFDIKWISVSKDIDGNLELKVGGEVSDD